MNFLLLNQAFWPDVVATSQYLTDLAVELVEQGHHVTVITSRRAYNDPAKHFPKRETWRGVRILRISSTGFGNGAKWKRAANFASFIFLCGIRLVFLPRFDAVVALTSPPLISFLGACFARFHRSRFYYWVMDFNPDEAIAVGWLRADSIAAKVLERMSRFSLREATKIIVLDRFMHERIVAKGIPAQKVEIISPWSLDGDVTFNSAGRERFRQKHGMEKSFVVMYSGNHSPCHPLDTLLEAARWLAAEQDILFCFIGGGSEFRKVQSASSGGRIVCLPYQPLAELSASLSAADLHVVVVGNAMVGLVHPCKIYNILSVAAPVLYIGPRPAHVTEIYDKFPVGTGPICFPAAHGEVDKVVEHIFQARSRAKQLARGGAEISTASYSKGAVLPRILKLLTAITPAGEVKNTDRAMTWVPEWDEDWEV
jgi:colanic acid biosynthesis glycosyl transferase WcaI